MTAVPSKPTRKPGGSQVWGMGLESTWARLQWGRPKGIIPLVQAKTTEVSEATLLGARNRLSDSE